MKNWPGTPGSIGPGRDPQQGVGPDRLGAGDPQLRSSHPEEDAREVVRVTKSPVHPYR